jgi:hypothetical protein
MTVEVAASIRGVSSILAGAQYCLDTIGDLTTARLLFDAAYRMAEDTGAVEEQAAAALGSAGLWVHENRAGATAAVLETRLRRVLGLLDRDSPYALRIRARLAAEATYRGDGSAAIREVLDEARSSTHPVAHVEALSLAHHCLLGPEHGRLRRQLATEMIGESARTHRRSDLIVGLLWRTVDLFLDGDPHAQRRLEELRAVLAEQEHLAAGYVVHAMDVMLAIRAGRFDDAERLAQQCFDLGIAAGDVDAPGWHGAHLVAIRWYQGRLAELLPMLEQLVHSPTLSEIDNAYFAVQAVAAASVGDQRTARGALARLRGRGLAELSRSSSWLVTMHGVVEAARLLADRELAAEAYALIEPYAELPAMVSLGVACFGSVHHALGVAALTMKDRDRAVLHLTESIARNRALGHWPAVEASHAVHAQALQLDSPPAICVREGQTWRFTWAGRSILVPNRIGMLHLAVLVANPGTEIPAAELAMGVAGLASAQPVLDAQALRRYRKRVADLQIRIDELDRHGDHDLVAQVRAERDALMRHLAVGTGIGRRSRTFSGDAERARLAVGKAIRRALSRLADADPVIGDHLHAAIHTGVQCSYRPEVRDSGR